MSWLERLKEELAKERLKEEISTDPPPLPSDRSDKSPFGTFGSSLEEGIGEKKHNLSSTTMRQYHYRLTDQPGKWLAYIAPNTEYEEAKKQLKDKFGLRFIECKEKV